MTNINKNILTKESKMSDAIRVLQESNYKLVLIICNKKLVGTITDGDIRRGLLNNLNLDNKCHEIMNKNPKSAKINQLSYIKDLLQTHPYIPIVDDTNNIIKIVSSTDMQIEQRNQCAALIMAGGKGERLHPLTLKTPKPLLPLQKKPIIHEIIERLHNHNLKDIYISIHYKGDTIKDYFIKTLNNSIKVNFLEEKEPLGTAGSLSLLQSKKTESPVVIINGDVLTDINYSELINYHNSSNLDITVCASFYDIQIPFGTIEIENDKLVNIAEKPLKKYLINAGIYVVNPNIINDLEYNKRIDMTDIITKAIKNTNVGSFPMLEQWLDIGSHANYEKAKK